MFNLKNLMKRSIAVLLCTAFIITGIFSTGTVLTANAAGTTIAGVITKSTKLRKGPTTEFDVVTTLSVGDTVKIKSRVWETSYEVTATHNGKTYNGYVGYASVKAAKTVPESMERTSVPWPDQTDNPLIGLTYYVVKAAYLRKSATGASAKVVSLSVNDECVIVKSGMGWYKVKAIHNGKVYSGCIYGKYLAAKKESYKGKIGYVNYDFLNVRKSASTSASKTGKLYKSQKVTIQSLSKGFYKISYVSGSDTKTGYVSTEYISIVTKGTLNSRVFLHKKRSGTSASLATLTSGTKVTIVSEIKGWMKVKYTVNSKTLTGYVLAECIDV